MQQQWYKPDSSLPLGSCLEAFDQQALPDAPYLSELASPVKEGKSRYSIFVVKVKKNTRPKLIDQEIRLFTQVTRFSCPDGCDISTGLRPVSNSRRTTP